MNEVTETYPYAKHNCEVIAKEHHWIRKRDSPSGMFPMLRTWEVAGVHFSQDGVINQATLERYYEKGAKPRNRKLCEYDVVVMWALAACHTKSLAALESELAGRTLKRDGNVITHMFYRDELMESIGRLRAIGALNNEFDQTALKAQGGNGHVDTASRKQQDRRTRRVSTRRSTGR